MLKKAIAINICRANDDIEKINSSLDELQMLLITAGFKTVRKIIQKTDTVHPSHFIGSGKVNEIKAVIDEEGIELAAFDSELSPAQGNNLMDEFNIKVADRTEIILDIFASHAKTKEAKIQVELAQLKYMQPRLSKKGIELSQQAGGIGTRRGPGETKLEVDRRHIKKRIEYLKKELKQIKHYRNQQRKGRKNILQAAIIGYTNAGKSTVMKALTKKDVLIEDKLFATLDTTVRKLFLPNGKQILISDTVGFINNLPHSLVESFKSTLEEAALADLLIHIVDISAPLLDEKIRNVYSILKELDIKGKKMITVLNKKDLVDSKVTLHKYRVKLPNAISATASSGEGIDELKEKIQQILFGDWPRYEAEINKDENEIYDKIKKYGITENEEYDGEKIKISFCAEDELYNYLKTSGLSIKEM